MGKVKYAIFSLILSLFCLPILVACSGGVPLNGISPIKTQYSVIQGESVQLEIEFTPAEATNKDVTYRVVSGEQFVSVDKNGVVTAISTDGKAHEALVVATADFDSNMKASFKVRVLANKITLDAPSGLVFNESSKSIVWNRVEFVDEEGIIGDHEPCYALAIAKGDETDVSKAKVFELEKKNSYKFGSPEFLSSGTYSVWVKSVSDDEDTFVDSPYSERYVFTILDSASNIEVKNNEIVVPMLNGNGVEVNENNYVLSIQNKTTSEFLSETTMQKFVKETKTVDDKRCVVWKIPTENPGLDFGEGEFEAFVNVLGDGENLFNAPESGTKIFYQLTKPLNASLIGSEVVWDEVLHANEYEVVVNDLDPIIVTENKCSLENIVLNPTENTIKVKARGNGQEKLSSDFSFVTSIKLAKVQFVNNENEPVDDNNALSFDGTRTVLAWSPVQYAGSYKILVNGEKVTELLSGTHFEFIDDIMGFKDGKNTLSVVAVPETSLLESETITYVESDGKDLTLTKLVSPEVYVKNGVLAWNDVVGALSYELKLFYDGAPEDGEFIERGAGETTFSLQDTNEKSYPAGEYKVLLRAIGDNLYVRSAGEKSQKESFVKQSAPTNLKIDEEGTLHWTKDNNVSSEGDFVISIHNKAHSTSVDDVQIMVSTNKNSENISSYLSGSGFGEYVFSIKTVNRKSSSNYLSSEESEKVGFYRLNAPTGLTVSNGNIKWNALDTGFNDINAAIEDKFEFVLKIGGNIPIVDEWDATSHTLLPSDCNAGRYTASLMARVKSGGGNSNLIEISGTKIYLLSSEMTSLDITKLSAPAKPEVDGNFLKGTVVDGASSYGIQITYSSGGSSVITTQTEQNGYWVVPFDQVEAIAQNDGIYSVFVKAFGGDNYIDSNYSREKLDLCKLKSPSPRIDENYKVVWDDVSATINNELVYAQNYEISFKVAGGSDWSNDASQTASWNTDFLADDVKYSLRIKASSNNANIITSEYSTEFEFTKLKKVDYSTIQVKSAYPYNTITWDRAYIGDNVNYLVSVYRPITTGGKTLVSQTVVEDVSGINPEFVFDNSYNLEKYEISIQTIAENKVQSGVNATNFVIKRLSRPTNLDVFMSETENRNYVLSWKDEKDVNLYAVYSDGVSVENGVTQKKLTLSDKLDAGSHKITVQAINNTVLTQSENSLTISSAESKEYLTVKLQPALMTVSNGVISWVDSNSSSNGYRLVFDSQVSGLSKVVELSGEQKTYDMSDGELATGAFRVSMTVLGNNENYIESDSSQIASTIQKLQTPKLMVENGMVTWFNVAGASTYSVSCYPKTGSGNIQVRTVASPDDLVSVFDGRTGEIAFTLKAVGGGLGEGSGVVYINSSETEKTTVFKWEVPTGLKVVDGEIVWNRISVEEESDSGRQKFGAYNVMFGDRETQVGRLENFFLSSKVTERETLPIKVCVMGTPFAQNANNAWINSDYTSPFTVTIAGAPILEVDNGVLKWRESGGDTNSYSEYEILVNDIVSAEINTTQTLLTMNTFGNIQSYSAENIDKINQIQAITSLDTIKVRHKGSLLKTSSSYLNYVNSGYSNVIENVRKLLTPTGAKINEEGCFEWVQGSTEEDVVIKVDGAIITKIGEGDDKNYSLNGQTGNLDFSSTAFQGGNFSVSISYYAQRENYEVDGTTYVCLNSDEASINAYRFSKVNDIYVSDDGLKLVWSFKNQSSAASNDKFIVTYKYKSKNDNRSFDSIDSETKVFLRDDIDIDSVDQSQMVTASVPLWGVGTYQVSIQVGSTSFNVIPSESVSLDEFKFDKFYSGEGSVDSPFIIKSFALGEDGFYDSSITATEQFYYIKKMPSKFFQLEEDVTLYDGGELSAAAKMSLDDICTNYMFNEEEFGSCVLTGGIYGNGHAVNNYKVFESSASASLFMFVVGDEIEGAGVANNFYGRSGIINNLTLKVAGFEFGDNYYDIGFMATYGYGAWFVDCTLSMDENAFVGENPSINIQTSASTDILYGGIVTRLYSAYKVVDEEDTNYNKKGRLLNCLTSMNITITRANNQENLNTRIGGVAGAIYGASVLNCTNAGNLGASQIGGVVYESNDNDSLNGFNLKTLYPSIDWENVIAGSQNTGTLTSYATKTQAGMSSGTASQSGGILAFCGTKTYVVNCLQAGHLVVSNGNYILNPNSGTVVATIGGIVGVKGGDLYVANAINLAKEVEYDSRRVDGNSSSFYGVCASSTITGIVGTYYNSSTGSNYNGAMSNMLSLGVVESDLINGTNMDFMTFGTIDGDSIRNMPSSVSKTQNGTTIALNTQILYDTKVKKINMLYFNGTELPELKTYIVA